MEKEINIAEILKDKPVNTKLYSLIFGDVYLSFIGADFVTVKHHGTSADYQLNAKLYDYDEAEPSLFPSKSMRDWSKFAWKKGDVLICKDNTQIIFEKFEDNTYTRFKGKHYLFKLYTKEDYCKETPQMTTSSFEKANDYEAQSYIKTIEKKLGGKFNRETLEVEKPQPEFKDGDILYITDRIVSCNFIMIYKNQEGDRIYHYATLPEDNLVIMTKRGFLSDNGGLSKRYATEEEKLQLFEALAKEGKAWDAEKKAIVDLKPKCEFKPFDRCIWKIRNCEGSIWQASFVSYVDEYGATPMGMSIDEDLVNLIILPYNDQTKLLVGTTDEWEGGEQ